MEVKLTVMKVTMPFSVPDSIRVGMSKSTDLRDFSEIQQIMLSDLSPDQLLQMCNEFRDNVFKRAGIELPTLWSGE